MKLHAKEVSASIFNRGEGTVFAGADCVEPRWQRYDFVSVAIPNREFRRQPVEQRARSCDLQSAGSEFTAIGEFDQSIKLQGHEMHSVTDPKYRDAERKYGRVRDRCARCEHASRSTRENDAFWLEFLDMISRKIERHYLRIDTAFADPPRDDLRVL